MLNKALAEYVDMCACVCACVLFQFNLDPSYTSASKTLILKEMPGAFDRGLCVYLRSSLQVKANSTATCYEGAGLVYFNKCSKEKYQGDISSMDAVQQNKTNIPFLVLLTHFLSCIIRINVFEVARIPPAFLCL